MACEALGYEADVLIGIESVRHVDSKQKLAPCPANPHGNSGKTDGSKVANDKSIHLFDIQ